MPAIGNYVIRTGLEVGKSKFALVIGIELLMSCDVSKSSAGHGWWRHPGTALREQFQIGFRDRDSVGSYDTSCDHGIRSKPDNLLFRIRPGPYKAKLRIEKAGRAYSHNIM